MLDYSQQNKLAAQWLLEYPERRQQYLTRLNEFSALSAAPITDMPRGSDVSQPTQNKALTLAHLEEQMAWIRTIEETEQTLSEKKRAFLDARRWVDKHMISENGRPGWFDETLARYSDWFYRRYGTVSYPDRKTTTAWWNDIINIAVRIAILRGILK